MDRDLHLIRPGWHEKTVVRPFIPGCYCDGRPTANISHGYSASERLHQISKEGAEVNARPIANPKAALT